MPRATRSETGKSVGVASRALTRTNMSSTPMPMRTKGRTLMTWTSSEGESMRWRGEHAVEGRACTCGDEGAC
eukprot:4149005-Prymnesium_polylepis.1